MKTRIAHIAVVMTLVIGIFCLNAPKAGAVSPRTIAIIMRALGLVLPQAQTLPPPPVNPPTGVVRPPVAPGPPPPKPPVPKPPRPVRPPLPRPNPGISATRPGRSLLGRLANGKMIRAGGRFIAPIALVSLAIEGGHLLAAGVNAMEKDADRVMAQNVARAEDCYRNPAKCGYSGRFDAPSGSFQSLYNATRPY